MIGLGLLGQIAAQLMKPPVAESEGIRRRAATVHTATLKPAKVVVAVVTSTHRGASYG